jgi:hypothetical protein
LRQPKKEETVEAKTKKKYVLAPLPKENAWEKRKNNPDITVRDNSEATPSTESVRMNTQPSESD